MYNCAGGDRNPRPHEVPMKNFDSNEKGQGLSKILRDWKVSAPLPPRFQEQVWHRIARSEAESSLPFWSGFLNWLEMALPRRAVAASYLSVLLFAGVATGYWHGQEKAAYVQNELGSRYVQSVDPYQSRMVKK